MSEKGKATHKAYCDYLIEKTNLRKSKGIKTNNMSKREIIMALSS